MNCFLNGTLQVLKGILVFLLRIVGIVLAKALKLLGEIFNAIGHELEKKATK